MTVSSARTTHGDDSTFSRGETLVEVDDPMVGVFSGPFNYLSEFATAEVHRRKAAAHIAAAEFIESQAKQKAAIS